MKKNWLRTLFITAGSILSTVALATQLTLTGAGKPSGAVAPATVAFASSAVSGAATSSRNYGTLSLGTAAADRKIVVISSQANTINATSVSVAGNAAAKISADVVGATANLSIWIVAVAAGATGNVTVGYSGSSDRGGVGIYAVYGASSTPSDTGSSTANPGTDTIDVVAGGVVVAGYFTGGATSTYTWTNVTEGYDQTVDASYTHTGAAAAFAGAQTGLAITATPSGSPSERAFAVVSLPPGP